MCPPGSQYHGRVDAAFDTMPDPELIELGATSLPGMTRSRLSHQRTGGMEPVAQVGRRCFLVRFGFFDAPVWYHADRAERRLIVKAACRRASADDVENPLDHARAGVRANRSGLPGGSGSAMLGVRGRDMSSRRSRCPAASDLRPIRRTSRYASCPRPAYIRPGQDGRRMLSKRFDNLPYFNRQFLQPKRTAPTILGNCHRLDETRSVASGCTRRLRCNREDSNDNVS